MVETAYRLSILIAIMAVVCVAKGQDPHFAGVQNMNIWYNPSLKTNKVPDANVSIRNVKYPNIIAYTSKAATIELPLISKKKDDEDNIFFMNLAAGICNDNSGNNIMNVSSAMLALSYALPLNYDNTYLAIGFQSLYTFSKFGSDGSIHFPEKFDKYGAIGSAIKSDPFQSGFNYGYFTAGAGVALFHNGEKSQWYIGGSVRHFNHPYTEWTHTAALSSAYGIQVAYTSAIGSSDAIGGYANYSSQHDVREQIIGARYTYNLDDSANNQFSLGTGYRIGDVFMPNVELKFGNNRLAFYYEVKTPGTASDNYYRRAYEFFYKRNL